MRALHLLVPVWLVMSASPAHALPSNDVSWGKPGVSLDQYARDARECSDLTRTVTVSIKPKTLRALDALSSAALLDLAMQASQQGDFNPMTAADAIGTQKSAEDIARRSNTFGGEYVSLVRSDVKDELQHILNKCLRERGYVPIKLTDDQKRQLSKMKKHTSERTAYLHSIDSNDTIIDRQKISEQP